MKAQCVYLTPDFAKTKKFYSTCSFDTLECNSIWFSYMLLLLIQRVMFICLILSLFFSHHPCLLSSGVIYSFHSDSVFADQTQDHRKVSSFPSLFYLFLWSFFFPCVPSFSLIILLFIPLLTLLLAVLNDETSQDTAVDNSADFFTH